MARPRQVNMALLRKDSTAHHRRKASMELLRLRVNTGLHLQDSMARLRPVSMVRHLHKGSTALLHQANMVLLHRRDSMARLPRVSMEHLRHKDSMGLHHPGSTALHLPVAVSVARLRKHRLAMALNEPRIST